MSKKNVRYAAILMTAAVFIITGIIIFRCNSDAPAEETIKKSLIYFYDYDTEELVFYEDGVKLDIDIGKTKSYYSYTVKVGNAGDAFYVSVLSGAYMYYNGVLKKIEKDVNRGITYCVSPTAKSIVYTLDNKIYIYDIVTDENRYICDDIDGDLYSVMGSICFSPDGRTIVYSPYCDKKRDREVWMYNDGEIQKIMEHAVPIAVTNDGKEIYVQDYNNDEPLPRIMVIKEFGRDVVLTNGIHSGVSSFNNNNKQFLYLARLSDTEYSTYLYDDGKLLNLSDALIKYAGETYDRDYCGEDLHFTGGVYLEIYFGYESSLTDGYFILYNTDGYFLVCIDKNGKVNNISDKCIYKAFSINKNGKYIYYGCGDDNRNGVCAYCLTEDADVYLAEMVRDLANYNNEGTYILADFDRDKMTGILYYCDDGKNLQYVMDNVTYVKAEGPHVYIMVKVSEDKEIYDVYYGNPTSGYEKIEDNVYYEDKESVL